MIRAAALEFLRELAANNNKLWFEAHRAEYETEVRDPVAELVASVTTELTRRGVPLEGDPKRSMFRLHRDVRFSKNKSPYKTHVGAVWFRQGGSRDGGSGILYFHLEPSGCFGACAFYMPTAETLECIRERIRVHPDKFLAVEDNLSRVALTLWRDDRLVRMPKGFEDLKDTPVADALRLKSFVVRRELAVKLVTSKQLPERLASLAEEALPLLRFGWAAMDEVRAG